MDRLYDTITTMISSKPISQHRPKTEKIPRIVVVQGFRLRKEPEGAQVRGDEREAGRADHDALRRAGFGSPGVRRRACIRSLRPAGSNACGQCVVVMWSSAATARASSTPAGAHAAGVKHT